MNEEEKFDVIKKMLSEAFDNGLETEVVLSFVEAISEGETDFKRAADFAMREWDV